MDQHVCECAAYRMMLFLHLLSQTKNQCPHHIHTSYPLLHKQCLLLQIQPRAPLSLNLAIVEDGALYYVGPIGIGMPTVKGLLLGVCGNAPFDAPRDNLMHIGNCAKLFLTCTRHRMMQEVKSASACWTSTRGVGHSGHRLPLAAGVPSLFGPGAS